VKDSPLLPSPLLERWGYTPIGPLSISIIHKSLLYRRVERCYIQMNTFNTVSTKEFSEKNGQLKRILPLKNEGSVLYTKHRDNGQTEDVRGIGVKNAMGTSFVFALSSGLSKLSLDELKKQFWNLQVGTQQYVDKQGNMKEMNILCRNGRELDEEAGLDL